MFVVNTLITDLEVSITLIVHCSGTLSKTAVYKCQSNLNFSNVSSDLVEDGGYGEGVVGLHYKRLFSLRSYHIITKDHFTMFGFF